MPLLPPHRIVIRLCGVILALAASWVSPWIPEGEGAQGTVRSPFVQLHVESLRREIVEEDQPNHQVKVDAGINRVTARVGLALSDGWRFYLIGGGVDLDIPDFDFYNAKGGILYGLGIGRTTGRTFFDGTVLTFTTDDSVQTVEALPQREEIVWTEYLLRAGLIFPMKRMEPFIGIRVSEVQGVDRLSGAGRLTFENKNAVGLFGGLKVPVTGVLAVTAEFSLLDEEGVRISVGREF